MKKAVLLTTLVATVALPARASPATAVGETVNPTGFSCNPIAKFFQGVSPSNQFVVPYEGVITSWSFLGGVTAPSQMKLKLARVGASTLDVVAESDFQTPVANQLNTFPSRVPAHADEVIGFDLKSPSLVPCGTDPAAGYTTDYVVGDLAPGTSNAAFSSLPNLHLDLSARLEPDADHDGYGDETQDQCPTNASTQGPCRASETGERAAALKNCTRKAKKKHWSKTRLKKCKKQARLLPI